MRTARLEQLLALGKTLATVSSYEETCSELTRYAAEIVGAKNVSIAIVDSNREVAHVYRGPNVVGTASGIRVISLDDDVPSTAPIRSMEPLIIPSSADFAARYPNLDSVVGPDEDRVLTCFPLTHQGVAIGSMFFRFREGFTLDDDIAWLLAEIVELTTLHVVRIKASAELQNHARRLEQSNTDLENYAMVVAHDFRSPVRRIRSFTQLLVGEIQPLTGDASDYAEAITRQVSYLDRLLSDVLAYSAVLAPSDKSEPVDFQELVDEVIGDLRQPLLAKSGTITRTDLPKLVGQETLLRQVVTNIIQNAISYSRPGVAPEIAISAAQTVVTENTPWWRISVKDNGRGFEGDSHKSAFKMFTRMDPHDGIEGTGIGLAFSKRVVELHGGEIGIETLAEGGSEVWFTLAGPASAHAFL